MRFPTDDLPVKKHTVCNEVLKSRFKVWAFQLLGLQLLVFLGAEHVTFNLFLAYIIYNSRLAFFGGQGTQPLGIDGRHRLSADIGTAGNHSLAEHAAHHAPLPITGFRV